MKKTLKTAAKLILFLSIGLFLVWLITRNFSAKQWQEIRIVFRQANYWLLIPVLLLGALSHYIRSLRWRLLIRPLGYNPSIINTFGAVMTGYLANLAVPRLGELVRCAVLSRQERLPVDQVVGTMIAERVIDMICLVLIIVFTVLIQTQRVGDFFYDNVWMKVKSAFSSGQGSHLLQICIIVILICAAFWGALRLFRHSKWHHKFLELLKGVKEGVLTALKLPDKGLFLAYTFLVWLCYFLMVYIGFYCFAETSVLGIKAGLSVLSFGSIGMILTQGGLGAYQLLVEKTLNLYGIADVYGFAFSWLSWLAQTGLIIFLGFFSFLLLPFFKRSEKRMKSPDALKIS